jgi:hypothetical protein
MRTVDRSYTISDERLRAYAQVPLIDRLRWLDELVRFTLLWRAAPRVSIPSHECDRRGDHRDEEDERP